MILFQAAFVNLQFKGSHNMVFITNDTGTLRNKPDYTLWYGLLTVAE